MLLLAMILCQDPAEFFPHADGMKWTYETADGKETVKTVTKTRIRNFGPWGVFEEAAVDGVTKEGVKLTLSEARDAIVWLKSVKKGERWTAKLSLGDVACDFTFEVLGDEEVDVPAGKHAGVKVRITFADGEGTSGTWTIWYAKGVGEVKSVMTVKSRAKEETFERRLKSFVR
jgi:hypothetical protein